MMFKKKFFVLTLVFILIFPSLSFAEKKENTNNNKTLIIYEIEKDQNTYENKVNYLNELLYVFNNNVEKIQINNYKSGYLKNFNSVFVINIKNDITNTNLLDDLSNYNKKIYWIENKIDNFLGYTNKYNIRYNKKNNSINKLIYNEKSILLSSSNLFNIIKPSKTSTTLATMSDGYNTYPFIIKENNLYYISRWDLDLSYIFEDSLNTFYNITNFNTQKIFVRIEDVHPFRDTKKLREIADYLYSQSVPFMIALIPTYVDTNTNTINTMDMKPEFIETIKYMQDKGGSVILHGYTHQIGTEEISGEGYEFWDIKNDTPIEENIKTYIKNRVYKGVKLCVENDIYPLGFEAPHYAMNSDGYKELKKYFSTYVGQFQNNNENFTTNSSPFTIKNSNNFNIFIPENLGYIDKDDMFSVDEIKANFEKISMVRGYTGGFFFHTFLDIDYLKEIIEFLKAENVQFLDLKEENNYVKIDDINITSKNGKISSNYNTSKKNNLQNKQTKLEAWLQNMNKIIVIFITSILIIFIIILIVFRKIYTKKFTRR